MTWFVLAIAGLLLWLWWRGRLSPRAIRWAVGGLAAALALALVLRGSPLLAAALLAVAALWAWSDAARDRPRPGAAGDPAIDVARARAILGVCEDADEQEIRLAHRRLMAGVHPDRGGSSSEAQALNAARDRLLEALKQRRAAATDDARKDWEGRT